MINNFRLKNVFEEKPPYLDKYLNINGYTIYRSNFNTSYFTIHDENFDVYRVIECHGADPRVLNGNLEAYIQYYDNLPEEDKTF